MARYKVRPGSVLAHGGAVLDEGTIVELPRHVAEDSIVRDLVQEVDDTGAPVLSIAPIEADIDRFRPHERISLLQTRLIEARAMVSRLEARIAIEQRTVDEASRPAASSLAPPARVRAPKDEE